MTMNAKLRTTAWVVLVALLLSGCASMPNASEESVNNRRVEFALTKHEATIPVVFENGLGGRMEWWSKIVPTISKDTTTFVYNRPGYGKSTPALTPRDGSHVVDELRSLLRSKGLLPPYILVGHSLGGLYMQLFARRYPDEVSALILVDSTHPQQLEGDGALEKQSILVRGLLGVLVTGTAQQELEMLPDTGRQVLNLPTLKGKPIFVLSASGPLKEKTPQANDANAKRKDIARLYPGSRQIWVDSGHAIPLEKPEAVISAIHEASQLIRSDSLETE